MSYQNGNTTVSDVKKSVSQGASKVGQEIKSEAKSAANRAERAIDSAKSETGSMAETVLKSAMAFLPAKSTEEVRSMLSNTVDEVQSGLKTASESASAFVRKYPVYSLLGAAALGAGAAMFFKMRKTPLSADADTSVRYDA